MTVWNFPPCYVHSRVDQCVVELPSGGGGSISSDQEFTCRNTAVLDRRQCYIKELERIVHECIGMESPKADQWRTFFSARVSDVWNSLDEKAVTVEDMNGFNSYLEDLGY